MLDSLVFLFNDIFKRSLQNSRHYVQNCIHIQEKTAKFQDLR